ncbi:MAG TPA: hypothetical protein VM262_13275 [Acidimicrobiales bacterium]|nr:hypothetical protein [Acidimicrobiales bacterium]
MPDIVDALADLRASIEWPAATADVSTAAVARLGPRRRRRWPLVLVAATVAVGAGAPAAAHLLSLGGVRVLIDGADHAGLPVVMDLGEPVAVRGDARRPPSLGPPAAAFAGRPDGGYSEVWPGPVVLTSFPGSLTSDSIEKRVAADGVMFTTVGPDPALWLTGPHRFAYLDPEGRPRTETVRSSANVLVWSRDGVTYRLESDRTLAEVVELAESMFAR